MSAAAELAALLKPPQAGLRLIHLHLGRLQTAPSAEQRQAIRQTLRTLGKQADAWRLFDMANGDLLMLYQGLRYTAAEAACKQVAGLLPDSTLTGLSPYPAAGMIVVDDPGPAGPLYDIVQLSENTGPVLRYLEAAGA
jgi:hypothetical protein